MEMEMVPVDVMEVPEEDEMDLGMVKRPQGSRSGLERSIECIVKTEFGIIKKWEEGRGRGGGNVVKRISEPISLFVSRCSSCCHMSQLLPRVATWVPTQREEVPGKHQLPLPTSHDVAWKEEPTKEGFSSNEKP